MLSHSLRSSLRGVHGSPKRPRGATPEVHHSSVVRPPLSPTSSAEPSGVYVAPTASETYTGGLKRSLRREGSGSGCGCMKQKGRSGVQHLRKDSAGAASQRNYRLAWAPATCRKPRGPAFIAGAGSSRTAARTHSAPSPAQPPVAAHAALGPNVRKTRSRRSPREEAEKENAPPRTPQNRPFRISS